MNQAELLDQFVIEARECLEGIGEKLLQVERSPDDTALLNDLFRSVHTLKGNCGLFEFKPLEQVVHAGEDLLDRVRNHTLAYSNGLADALLDAMDYSAQLIDQIERHGAIAEGAGAGAARHVAALRALLVAVPAGALAAVPAPASAAEPVPAAARPAWADALPAHAQARVALRYMPEPDCFFKGEDPWRLAATVPGLLHAAVAPLEPWPEGAALDGWDCYRCNLDIRLLSAATAAEVEAHFRCVPEQVALIDLTPPAAVHLVPEASEAPDAALLPLQQRSAVIWADQVALLSRAGQNPGVLHACARSLQGLLCARPEAEAAAALQSLPDPADAAALLGWARRHAPHGAAGPGAGAAATGAPTGAAISDLRATPDEPAADRQPRVLKVGQEKIDRLMDLIGEMVVAKNSLPYLAQRAEEVFQQRELAREIKAQYAVINRIAEDMQHAIMQVRMLPVGTVFQRFGRLVRDISRKLGKEVQMVVEGEDTEADKNVIEPLADPLIHILRNSLDHGIEAPEVRRAAGKPVQGTIRIVARQESDRVIIEISDDGAGVNAERVRSKAVERGLIPAERAATLTDHEAVQLIFLPGFSTAEAISDLSGRGVGMDVVRTAVERINGAVELTSRAGQGTTIRLSLPLSMAVTNVMVIESAGRRLGVPMDLIVETVRVHADDIHHFKQARTTVLRGRVVPLLALNDVLALDAAPLCNAEGEHAVLVVRLGSHGGGSVGLLVDHFRGASDIILKPLEGVLAGLTGFAGTALMGDGSVLMVLNPKELL
jgi:two-component system chemotaxis sensor kinase CheA